MQDTLEVRDSQDSLGLTLAKMSNIWESELEESTSTRQTGPQEKGWGYQPTVKVSDPELFLYKRTVGTEVEKTVNQREGGLENTMSLSVSLGITIVVIKATGKNNYPVCSKCIMNSQV